MHNVDFFSKNNDNNDKFYKRFVKCKKYYGRRNCITSTSNAKFGSFYSMSGSKNTAPSIGLFLRALRKKYFKGSMRGLSQRMGKKFSTAGISRRESGIYAIDDEYLECFCQAIELPEEEKRFLFSSLRLSEALSQGGNAKYTETILKLVKDSNRIDIHSTVIPSLLQTSKYTEAIVKTNYPQLDARAETVKLHKQWREIEAGKDRHVRQTFPEHILYAPIGSREVMTEQIRNLLNFNNSANIKFRILPMDAFVEAWTYYPFTIIDQKYAVAENVIRVATETDPAKVEKLQNDFDAIWNVSATKENLKAILQKALAHYQVMEQ